MKPRGRSELHPFECLSDDVVKLVFSFIPDKSEQFRLVGVYRRWDSLLLSDITFWGTSQRVFGRHLSFLCRRAGPGLRIVDVTAPVCRHVSSADLLIALQQASTSLQACPLRQLVAWRPEWLEEDATASSPRPVFSAGGLAKLRSLCPRLAAAACMLRLRGFDGASAAALAALPPEWAVHCEVLGQGSRVDASAIAEAIASSPPLASLHLAHNSLGLPPALERAIGGGASGGALRALAFTGQLVFEEGEDDETGPRGCRALGAAIAANASVTFLELTMNFLADGGARAVAAALRRNSTVTRLDLSANGIGPAGAEAIGAL